MRKENEIAMEIPDGITLKVSNNNVELSSAGKIVSQNFRIGGIGLEARNGRVIIKSKFKGNKTKKFANLVKSKIRNMVTGLQKGYEYRLEVIYSHFPMNIAVKEGCVEISNILGAKSPKKAKIVGSTMVEVKGKEIRVSGVDKEHVGQTAANIEQVTRIKGRDIRRFQDGIYIVSKGRG